MAASRWPMCLLKVKKPIITIKLNVTLVQKFQISHANHWVGMKFVNLLDASKSNNGNIPIKIIKIVKDNLCPYKLYRTVLSHTN